jgi:hypothetical protein
MEGLTEIPALAGISRFQGLPVVEDLDRRRREREHPLDGTAHRC